MGTGYCPFRARESHDGSTSFCTIRKQKKKELCIYNDETPLEKDGNEYVCTFKNVRIPEELYNSFEKIVEPYTLVDKLMVTSDSYSLLRYLEEKSEEIKELVTELSFTPF